MSQPEKPTTLDSTAKPQKPEDKPLTEGALEKVSGGAPSVSEITITKTTDKSTPILGG